MINFYLINWYRLYLEISDSGAITKVLISTSGR